jgi:elongation factor Ts
MSYTAKDVKTLRDTTGAGMMDCKKALEENNGDIDEAKQWLREKGLAASAKRDDRDNNQGVVALVIRGNVGAMAKLKCETDFVAGSDAFKAEAEALANLIIDKGVGLLVHLLPLAIDAFPYLPLPSAIGEFVESDFIFHFVAPSSRHRRLG